MELRKRPCTVMTVVQTDRNVTAPRVQEILTVFGCTIQARLGLHEATTDFCSPQGLILLVLCGAEQEVEAMASQLRALEGVKVQTMRIQG